MREIDERAAAMLAHGRAQKPKVVRQFLKDQLTSLKFDLPDQVCAVCACVRACVRSCVCVCVVCVCVVRLTCCVSS